MDESSMARRIRLIHTLYTSMNKVIVYKTTLITKNPCMVYYAI